MGITSIDIDADKLEQLKKLTGARSNREAVDEALDIALGVRRKRELVERVRAHGFTAALHEESKDRPEPAS